MYVSQLAALAISRVIKVTQARKERRFIRFRTPGNAKVTFHVGYAGRLVGGNSEQLDQTSRRCSKIYSCARKHGKTRKRRMQTIRSLLSFHLIPLFPFSFLSYLYLYIYSNIICFHLFQPNELYFLSITLAVVEWERGTPLPSAVRHFFPQSVSTDTETYPFSTLFAFGYSKLGTKLSTHNRLNPSFRMSGVTPPLHDLTAECLNL